MIEHPASLQALSVARMRSWRSCQLAWMPARGRPVTSATAPTEGRPRIPSSTGLSSNTTQPLRRSWQARAENFTDYVQREFDEYLNCGRLEYGFLSVQCDSCHEEQLPWAAPLLYQPPCRARKTTVTDVTRQGALRAEETPYRDGTTSLDYPVHMYR